MTDHNEPLGFSANAKFIRLQRAMDEHFKDLIAQPAIPVVKPIDTAELRKALAQLPVLA